MRTRKQKRIGGGPPGGRRIYGYGSGQGLEDVWRDASCVYWQGSLGHVTHEKLVDE